MDKRTPYHTIKIWYLRSAYKYSRTKFADGFIHEWKEKEIEWAEPSDSFEGSYDHPIEILMFKVVDITSRAGRNPIAHQYLLNEIHALLKQHKLEDLLKPLGKREKVEFMQDLNRVLQNSKIGKPHG